MNPWRAALLGGLIHTLAFALWLIGGLKPSASIPDPMPAYQALIWSQALVAALLLPATTTGREALTQALAPALLAAVPWPLVSLLSLLGAIPAAALIPGQLAVIAWAVVLGGLWYLLGRTFERPAMARAALQGVALLGTVAGLAGTAEAACR